MVGCVSVAFSGCCLLTVLVDQSSAHDATDWCKSHRVWSGRYCFAYFVQVETAMIQAVFPTSLASRILLYYVASCI
ncbi:hypothetical protein BJ166DRAFT_1215 [Pestalotiopsis sp. NC0098]|nr:hypothetical protein BJ166DRAFT_1215 [Pestalotiopsis sp. NC0098]